MMTSEEQDRITRKLHAVRYELICASEHDIAADVTIVMQYVGAAQTVESRGGVGPHAHVR